MTGLLMTGLPATGLLAAAGAAPQAAVSPSPRTVPFVAERAVVSAPGYWTRPQVSVEIWRASAKSFAVRPPAEWVLRVSVTLFHAIATSGWWLALSAR
jgi:hypothetical protein